MDWTDLWKTYKEIGEGGLFALLFVGTLLVVWKDIKEQRKTQMSTLEKVVTAMDKSTAASDNCTATMKQVKDSIDDNTQHTVEFIAYLKGRDNRG